MHLLFILLNKYSRKSNREFIFYGGDRVHTHNQVTGASLSYNVVGKGFSEKMTFELRLKYGEKSTVGISQEECCRQRVKKDKDLRQKRVLQ